MEWSLDVKQRYAAAVFQDQAKSKIGEESVDEKNNLLIKLLTLLIIIAAVLPVFYMPAYAVEEEYGTQDISDHGISEQGENITSSESETSYVEEGNNVFDIVPKGYTLKAVQTRSVEFIIQYPPGQPTGNVTYELKKEINNREIVVKRGTLNKSQKKITFKDAVQQGPVIISFWATWCKPCQSELEALKDLEDSWKNKVRIIAVSIDDARAMAKVKSLVKGKKWPFEVLLDPNKELYKAFKYFSNSLCFSYKR